MNMETQLGHKVRQILDHGAENISLIASKRLQGARQVALDHQRMAVHGFHLAGIGHAFSDVVLGHARIVFAAVALLAGASGSYFWHLYDEAAEFEEIDSALLADELPPAAYLDHGFRAWLDRSSPSSQ